ncbi:hypothetical protein H4R24_003246 [Coemansia sp. RSA 988]|nr:hypothetical protein H4R24_003246 [Coemansia sp. RSA 988]
MASAASKYSKPELDFGNGNQVNQQFMNMQEVEGPTHPSSMGPIRYGGVSNYQVPFQRQERSMAAVQPDVQYYNDRNMPPRAYVPSYANSAYPTAAKAKPIVLNTNTLTRSGYTSPARNTPQIRSPGYNRTISDKSTANVFKRPWDHMQSTKPSSALSTAPPSMLNAGPKFVDTGDNERKDNSLNEHELVRKRKADEPVFETAPKRIQQEYVPQSSAEETANSSIISKESEINASSGESGMERKLEKIHNDRTEIKEKLANLISDTNTQQSSILKWMANMEKQMDELASKVKKYQETPKPLEKPNGRSINSVPEPVQTELPNAKLLDGKSDDDKATNDKATNDSHAPRNVFFRDRVNPPSLHIADYSQMPKRKSPPQHSALQFQARPENIGY